MLSITIEGSNTMRSRTLVTDIADQCSRMGRIHQVGVMVSISVCYGSRSGVKPLSLHWLCHDPSYVHGQCDCLGVQFYCLLHKSKFKFLFP